MSFRIAYADITQLKVDAIVNPTDRWYSGGGGVDYQIHRLCGPALREATSELTELHLGEAKATPGFALPCKFIIHTSGPKWKNSHSLEISLLGSCYRNSVQLASLLGCKSIAFPLVSSKGKGFPKEQALTTAIDAILECSEEYPDMEIILTIFGKWTETLPDGFWEALSLLIEKYYEPEPDEDEFVLYEEATTCAEPSGVFHSATCLRSFITDLLDNPSQKTLDKIPVDESFAQMLNRLIEEHNTKTNDVLDQLGMSGAALSKLRNGKNNPQKNTVFALAIFFRLSFEDTTEMLMKAGFAFNPSSMQDIVLSGFIKEGIYDRYVIDGLLYDLDLQPLPGAVLD